MKNADSHLWLQQSYATRCHRRRIILSLPIGTLIKLQLVRNIVCAKQGPRHQAILWRTKSTKFPVQRNWHNIGRKRHFRDTELQSRIRRNIDKKPGGYPSLCLLVDNTNSTGSEYFLWELSRFWKPDKAVLFQIHQKWFCVPIRDPHCFHTKSVKWIQQNQQDSVSSWTRSHLFRGEAGTPNKTKKQRW